MNRYLLKGLLWRESIIEIQWLENLWGHENLFQIWAVKGGESHIVTPGQVNTPYEII